MVIKTMMIGCVAGEAHLDDGNDATRAATAEALAAGIVGHARALRDDLSCSRSFLPAIGTCCRVLCVRVSPEY